MKRTLIQFLNQRPKVNRFFNILIALIVFGITSISYGRDDSKGSNGHGTALEHIVSMPKQHVKISKSGLNRISNAPYKIMQVTGDENAYRIKSDEDGANIYIQPLKNLGEKIEISIKNSIGTNYDLELEVSNIKGQVINLRTEAEDEAGEKLLKIDISQMLNAMKLGKVGKFYVKDTKTMLGELGNLTVLQTKLYRWKDILGGVFTVSNPTKKIEILNLELFAQRFCNVLTFFSDKTYLTQGESARVFIIQKTQE
jgi:hypothetical protein